MIGTTKDTKSTKKDFDDLAEGVFAIQSAYRRRGVGRCVESVFLLD